MGSNLHPVEPEELMAYLDGESPHDRAAATAAHLEECRECQMLAAEMLRVSESLRAWQIETAEWAINEELAKAFEEREHKRAFVLGRLWNWFAGSHVRRAIPWAGGAVAGGLAVFLLTFVLILSPSPGERKPVIGAERPQPAAAQSAVAPVASAGKARGYLSSTLAFSQLAESQREELLSRQPMAQIASNLESNRTTTVEGQAAAELAVPMIIQTAQLTLVIENLDAARAQVDRIVQRYSGYVGDLTVSAPGNGARTLTATLRLPATQLDAALAELKKLGRVETETQNGQDVTAQYVDLAARLSNSRNTEKRLLELLSQRTGKLSDVLEVETELSRVRGEIERMEGERRLMAKQVEYATLTTTVTEEYKAPARALPDSLSTRLRNAAVDGYQSVVNFIIGVTLFLVSDGPMLLLWTAILFFPARWAWRKFRKYRETPTL
jgi:anti-sigma factor RsiW